MLWIHPNNIEALENGVSVEFLLWTYSLNYTAVQGNLTKKTWLLVSIVEFDWFKQPCAITHAETFKTSTKDQNGGDESRFCTIAVTFPKQLCNFMS